MPKILLVEDDNNLREIYEARLQAEGYTIVSARDGEEALVVAKAEKPDLVISDIMMPKISGFEMLDILRNTDGLKDVKVIMLTALGQSDDQKRADKLGADRYLVKSQVTLEDIVKATQELLNTGTTPMPSGATSSASTAPDQGGASAAAEPAATPAPSMPAPSEADAFKQAPDEPQASPAANATEDAHDQVMADAVETLVADTEDKDSSATTAVTPEPTPPPEETTAAATADQAAAGDTSPKHKKIISPIDSEPKKDIHALLAEEEAKESATPTPAENPAVTEAKEEQAATESENVASTTADEEANVEAKIEDFVAGATSEPSTPADQPAATQQTETPAADTPSKEKKITVTTDSTPSQPAATAGPTPAPLDDAKNPAGSDSSAV